jgi:hygromycin-B 7''-O-kinase
MVSKYSQRLGKITPEQFQAALARFGLGDFIRAAPIPFGLFGQNVFITSTQGEFVLRGVPHYSWQFPTERFFVDQLHHQTLVPVPYPYRVEPATDIFGWSFVIMPRLPGISLSDKSMAATLLIGDRLAIARALARTLAEAHTLTWECTGKYDPETQRVQPFTKGYDFWVIERIREKIARARSYNDHTLPSDVDWGESIIASAMRSPVIPFTPCAVLGDYGEHNVVVECTPDGWRVSGVFDLMTAHFGDGQADLSLPVTDYLGQNRLLSDAFIQEYIHHIAVQPGFAERQRLYMLNLKLSFWEYWQREKGGLPEDPAHALSLEQWAGTSVAYWDKF